MPHPPLRTCAIRALVLALVLTVPDACGSHAGTQADTAASAAPASPAEPTAPALATAPASATPNASASANAVPSANASASPDVATSTELTPSSAPSSTPTANPNLLSLANGAIVRRWTVGASSEGVEKLPMGYSWSVDAGFAKPVELVYELPARARLSGFGAWAGAAHIAVAVSDDDRAYQRVGVLSTSPSATTSAIAAEAAGRFVRFTVSDYGASRFTLESLSATGSLDAIAPAQLAGTWRSVDDLYASNDSAVAGVRGRLPPAFPNGAAPNVYATSVHDGTLTAFACNSADSVWRGRIDGPRATAGGEALTAVSGGAMLVGMAGGRNLLLYRTARAVACAPAVAGRGATIAVFSRSSAKNVPESDPSLVPGFRFERTQLPLLDLPALQRSRVALIAASCHAPNDLAPWQTALLLRWIGDGHSLIVRDADDCSASDYSFLPYAFATSAAGANGAAGSVLALADPSSLGSGPSDREHVVDVAAYLRHPNQQLGDADIMVTSDPHWCGLIYARNRNGTSGWIHAYARYGRGLIIYDGFDVDDVSAKIPPALRITDLEYRQSPSGELPCNALVSSPVTLYPSASRKIVPGRTQRQRFGLTLDYAAPVVTKTPAGPRTFALSVTGSAHVPSRIAPNPVTLKAGTSGALTFDVEVPAALRPGTYAFTIRADGAGGAAAEATITLDADVALGRELLASKRARLYGIHFDVASARIQPQSEAAIAQIAAVLRAYPRWRMRVEGHTDSDGGAAYNLALSKARAHAVVTDLERRYGIAGARLSAAGYGLTRPVAPNTTYAGKALNRRVELLRL